jgi:hypothetical protein
LVLKSLNLIKTRSFPLWPYNPPWMNLTTLSGLTCIVTVPQMEFAVRMTCQGCVKAVHQALESVEGELTQREFVCALAPRAAKIENLETC